ncbi:MAG: ABC transporter substrate-binding protein [Canidatus Methanoxibalbensis ujae]|nr:ABC transporter substrate-binding protein [Candidatus Methanoxibalbensis ujae]
MRITSVIAAVAVVFVFVFFLGFSVVSAAAEDDEGPGVIVIGYQPSTHQVAAMVAAEKGWWLQDLRRFGVEDVKLNEFATGPPEMDAMLIGDIDVAYVGTAPPIAAMYEGLDAKIVAGVQVQGSAIVVRRDLADEYREKGIAALKGCKIGTYPAGSIQHTILSKYLADNGMDPEKDVQIISQASPSEAASAIGSGSVDAVFLPSPWPAKIESEGSGVIVEWSGDIWKNHACCCLVVRGELIRENPELVKQIIRTHINATEYVKKHPEEAAEIFAKWQHENVSVILRSLNISDMQWIHDPHVLIDSGVEYAKVIYDLNRKRYEARGIHLLQADDIFDTSLYDEVIAEFNVTPATPTTPAPTTAPATPTTTTATPTATPVPGFEFWIVMISFAAVIVYMRGGRRNEGA